MIFRGTSVNTTKQLLSASGALAEAKQSLQQNLLTKVVPCSCNCANRQPPSRQNTNQPIPIRTPSCHFARTFLGWRKGCGIIQA
eukprot:455880-Amphidinium_carterae.1